MQRWLVELQGDRADLEEFPLRFPNGEIFAVEEDGKVYLTGPSFDQFLEGELVRNYAIDAVEEMSAIIQMLWPPFRKPAVGSVYRDEHSGGRSTWIFPVGASLRVKSGIPQVLSASPPSPVGQTDAQRLLKACRTTEFLHAATLLWIAADPAWWQLYRIVEELTEHLGMEPAKAGLCSQNELDRFEHTANSADASGLGARHRTRKYLPPKNPMSLDEAATFVKNLLEGALSRAAAETRTIER